MEVFLKALKQTLKIKTFVGTSASGAVRQQIWIALMAMLAPKFLRLHSRFSWSFLLTARLRQQLLFYRDRFV